MVNIQRYLLVFIFILLTCSPNFAEAAKAKRKKTPETPKYSALVIDESTGKVLYEKNATLPRYPASLAKMMTVYIAFESLKSGALTKNQHLYVSEFASSRPRSNMGLKTGDYITVYEAILCTIIKSANDAAVVLAEAISVYPTIDQLWGRK